MDHPCRDYVPHNTLYLVRCVIEFFTLHAEINVYYNYKKLTGTSKEKVKNCLTIRLIILFIFNPFGNTWICHVVIYFAHGDQQRNWP